jgi:serine/threonine-protein kinase
MRDKPPPSSGPPQQSSTTAVDSPLEALERDEILRTRWFCAIIISLGIAAALAATFIPGGHPVARVVVYVAVAGGIAGGAFMLNRTRDPVRFRHPTTALGWFTAAVCVNAAVLFFGVFSPAPMVVVLGLYFLGLGKARRVAFAAYVIIAASHAAFALVVIMHWAPDIGLVRPELTTVQQIIIQALVQIVMLTTVVTARLSRGTTLAAMSELEQAVRLAAHRQALLIEAREALDRALHNRRGRFTSQLIGRYHLGDVIGRGAMGEVYAGTDPGGGEQVAIKLLSHAALGDADLVRRFLRELRLAAGIESPHVVRVLEVGEQPVPYLVMERLDGETLGDILRNQQTLPAIEVVELIRQVGIGISAAASAGIVHRDLKPQNVFRHAGPTWKVLDFGVARGIDRGDTITAGQIVGTPAYMSPEQASGGRVDHRTDLYALAAIAYRAVTGQAPFVAREVAETLYLVVHTRPVRPTLVMPQLTPDIDLVLAIGMAADAHDRFATAEELAVALGDAFRGTLSPSVRARGEALIAAGGWSTTVPRKRGRA